MFDVQEALKELVRREGSDLHLKVGSTPLYRVHGHLAPEPGVDVLSAEDTERTLHELLKDERSCVSSARSTRSTSRSKSRASRATASMPSASAA